MEAVRLMIIKNERGLTLIEVLAAMAILSIIVIAFVNISGYMTLAFSKGDSETEAIRLAEKILTEERNRIDSLSTRPSVDYEKTIPVVNGYVVTINETALVNNPSYSQPLPTGLTNHVSVQGVVLLKNPNSVPVPNIDDPRLLTVTLSWGDTP